MHATSESYLITISHWTIRYQLCHSPVSITFVISGEFVILWTSKLPQQSLLHWFIQNWTTVTHYTTIYQPIRFSAYSIQNSLARAVCHTPKFSHISPTLKALHWLKVRERIEYKIASLTYTALQFHQPSYISDLLTIKSNGCNTRSSSLVTLNHPPVVKASITKRSFSYSAPALWNSLPSHLRQPAENNNNALAASRPHFLAQLKTFLFSKSYPP